MSSNGNDDTENGQDEEPLLTESAAIRFEWLSTAVAGITAISLPILVALATVEFPWGIGYLVHLDVVPQAWYGVYAIVVAASYGYVLNVNIIDRVSSLLANGIGGLSDGDQNQ